VAAHGAAPLAANEPRAIVLRDGAEPVDAHGLALAARPSGSATVEQVSRRASGVALLPTDRHDLQAAG